MEPRKTTEDANPAVLICIGGMSAAGKTTLGLGLLENYGEEYAVLIDPDATRNEVLNRPVGTPVHDEDLAPEITAKTIIRMLEKADEALGKEMIVIVPSAFVLPYMRENFEKRAEEKGVRFFGFWLDCPKDLREERKLERREMRENGIVDLRTVSQVTHAGTTKELDPGVVTWNVIDASGSKEQVLDTVLKQLPALAPSPPGTGHQKDAITTRHKL